jgi:NAD(P)H dehydrogenase (quinone)
MHALIVFDNPKPGSLTHLAAARIAHGIREQPGHTVETADLAAEGFDPRFTRADFAVHDDEGAMPADAAAEQQRIDRADALILVYPVFWWSMPGRLKGWIDRVFARGWAYGYGADGATDKKLERLQVHLVGLGLADRGTYERHGYQSAMQAQIEHGIFGYCGARVMSSTLLLPTESEYANQRLDSALDIGRQIFRLKQNL